MSLCYFFDSHVIETKTAGVFMGAFQKRFFSRYITLRLFFSPSKHSSSPFFSWCTDLHNNRMYHMFSFHFSHFSARGKLEGALSKNLTRLHKCTVENIIIEIFVCLALKA